MLDYKEVSFVLARGKFSWALNDLSIGGWGAILGNDL